MRNKISFYCLHGEQNIIVKFNKHPTFDDSISFIFIGYSGYIELLTAVMKIMTSMDVIKPKVMRPI